jgi:tRNA(fMet)-specific endonuclease VapC
MFLLDTDHVGILQRQTGPEYSRLAARVSRHPQTDFYVSIITLHEQFLGWNTYLSRARSTADVVTGYTRFHQAFAGFHAAQVLPFDQAAGAVFDALQRQRLRIGTMDLRIAVIALSRNLTVLTRNLRHFRKVPGLSVQDWTV